MASILNADGIPQCGGTLIAPDVVLTAAHCLYLISNGGSVEVGRYDYGSADNFDAFKVVEWKRHPYFSMSEKTNDFLLLFLDAASEFPFVALNSNANVPSTPGESLHIAGWGSIDASGTKYPYILQEVEVKYMPNEECENSMGFIGRASRSYHGQIHEEHLCAIDFNEDSCYGDSGGPLVWQDGKSRNPVQVGLVSWGFACSNNNFPGVYARVSGAYDWIKDTVCERSAYADKAFDCRKKDGEQCLSDVGCFSSFCGVEGICRDAPSPAPSVIKDGKCDTTKDCPVNQTCDKKNCRAGGLLNGSACSGRKECLSKRCTRGFCARTGKNRKA